MILATSNDIDYPHIDWKCSQCGMVYCSAGLPDDNRCLEGHDAAWKPEDRQIEEYIDFLESLEVGDGLLFAGDVYPHALRSTPRPSISRPAGSASPRSRPFSGGLMSARR